MSDRLPKDNPFFNATPQMREEAGRNLLRAMTWEIQCLTCRGNGKHGLIMHLLGQIQKCLIDLQEWGFEVGLMDEKVWPELAEALGPLIRAGLENEVRRIIRDELAKCLIPREENTLPSVKLMRQA